MKQKRARVHLTTLPQPDSVLDNCYDTETIMGCQPWSAPERAVFCGGVQHAY